MYDFNAILLPGEEILYQGKGEVKKGERAYGGYLFVFIFCAMIEAILCWFIKDDSS